MERAEAAEGAAWLQWRKVARKEYKRERQRRCREEEEEEKDSRGRQVRNEIAQEVFAGIKEKASAHENAKSTAQRTARPKSQATLGQFAN